MSDWFKVLAAVAPKGRADILRGAGLAMPGVCAAYEISPGLRQAHFIAQCAHESDGMKTTTEYASGDAYEGRHDLGNTQPGDGRRFKGRGLIQVTGRANYRDMGARLGVDLMANPDSVASFPPAAITAGAYWGWRKINRLADKDDLHAVTRAVNGGINGLASRAVYLVRAKAALAGQDMGDDQAKTAARDHLNTAAEKAKAHASGHKKAAGGAGMGGTGAAAAAHGTHGHTGVTIALVALALAVAGYFAWQAWRAGAKSTALSEAAKGVQP